MKFVKFSILAILLLFGTVQAQKGVMKVEPALIVALPSESGVNTGFGVTGTFFYGINEKIDLIGTLGYISFGYDGFDGSFSTVPFLVGEDIISN